MATSAHSPVEDSAITLRRSTSRLRLRLAIRRVIVYSGGGVEVQQMPEMQPAPIEPMECWQTPPGMAPVVLRPLVHIFTHNRLPTAFFASDPMMLAAMDAKSPFHGNLQHIWSKSAIACSSAGFWPEDAVLDDERYLDYLRQLAAATTLEKISTARGLVFWLVTMPRAVAPMEAQYIALYSGANQPPELHKHSAERRYLLLELGVLPGEAYSCEWAAPHAVMYPSEPSLQHGNRGSVKWLGRDEFIDHVEQVLDSGRHGA